MCSADGLNALPNVANSHPADISIKNKDGSPTIRPDQTAIIGPEVCHVGEIVAAVVATSLAAAKDAAELVAVDYEVFPAVAHSLVAAEPDAPRARRDSPNIILDGEVGDPVATEAAFADGRACRPVRDLGAAHRRCADGAARRGRRVRPRDRPLYACMPGPAARSARGAIWRWCSASRRSRRAS